MKIQPEPDILSAKKGSMLLKKPFNFFSRFNEKLNQRDLNDFSFWS